MKFLWSGQNVRKIVNVSKKIKSLETFHILDDRLFDVHASDNNGWTVLYFLARKGSYESVVSLANLETDIHLKKNIGSNCLHIAATFEHLNPSKTLAEIHKFDLYMTDNNGWTAINYSVRNRSSELVMYFAGLRTNIHLRTNVGWNCLHIAPFYGYFNLCKILTKKI